MRQYRLIYDHPTTGATNMAVDEAIMLAVAAGEAPPTLRFYAWDPACLSLGYGQSYHDADLERIHQLGWHLVRRVTGGRSILHTDELTYSITLPAHHALAQGSIIDSYRRISRALVVAIEGLGAEPRADKRAEGVRSKGPVCFEVPSHYEITTPDGRKLVGSAQSRRRGVVLQHGSLPLHGDIARICEALHFEDESEREATKGKVRARAATLADALGGRVISWEHAANAIAYAFAQTFDAQLVEGSLSPAEAANAARLAREVYMNPEHIQRL